MIREDLILYLEGLGFRKIEKDRWEKEYKYFSENEDREQSTLPNPKIRFDLGLNKITETHISSTGKKRLITSTTYDKIKFQDGKIVI
jgi:hypothetical protein